VIGVVRGAAGYLVIVGALLSGPASATTCDLTFEGGNVLRDVPVAETRTEQERGLSDRDDVGPGMLFTWSTAEPRVVWMRDTRVPLTVGWIDAEGVLFGFEDMEPETDDMHLSMEPAAAALELPQGAFERHGLAEGDRLLSRDCRHP